MSCDQMCVTRGAPPSRFTVAACVLTLVALGLVASLGKSLGSLEGESEVYDVVSGQDDHDALRAELLSSTSGNESGLAGDFSLVQSQGEGDGDGEGEGDGEGDGDDEEGGGTNASAPAPAPAPPPAARRAVDPQIARDLAPFVRRGVKLSAIWLTKHNFTASLGRSPGWVPYANRGLLNYTQLFTPSGLRGRTQQLKHIYALPNVKLKAQRRLAGGSDGDGDGDGAAGGGEEADGAAGEAPQPPSPSWGGLGPNLYDDVEDHVGRPLGMFDTFVIDGVPYFAEEDVESALQTYYFGMLVKVYSGLAMLRSSIVWERRQALAALPDRGAAVAAALGLPANRSKAAAEWTAGVVPDAYFLWNIDPFPVLPKRGRGSRAVAPPAVPVFSLCKTDEHLDVLYPNMYFVSPDGWRRVTKRMRAANWAHPWQGRKDSVWWRGSAGFTYPGSMPRISVLAQWHRARWADLAFTDSWAATYWRWRRTWKPRVFHTRIPAAARHVRSGRQWSMPMSRVAEYKYSLHLPGYYSATYSRMLQFLFWTGTAIFKLENPYYEFYYHHLKRWVHFVPVDVNNLGARVSELRANASRASALVAAAGDIARTVLSHGAVAAYWVDLLRAYAALQQFDVAAGATRGRRLCTCWPVQGRHGRDSATPARVADLMAAAQAQRPAWVTHPGASYCGLLCRPVAIALEARFQGRGVQPAPR